MTLSLLLTLGLAAVLMPVTVIDLRRRVVPDAITAPAALGALGAALALDRGFVGQQLAAGAAAGGFLGAAALLAPGGMGMGDAKLAAVLGLYLGRAVAARRGLSEGRRATLPFAPFLAFGALVALAEGGLGG